MKRQAPQYSHRASWLFGKPVLRSGGQGKVGWYSGNDLSQIQKGGGWSAELYGGVQTGDDWAGCYVPVNDMPIREFTDAAWSWYQTATETMGLGIVVWIHDQDDNDKRAEITQVGGIAGLAKTVGQNAHSFDKTVTQMFFYGENTTGTALTAGTQYTWAQFQADPLFKDWTIYRISFEWGWEASGTFESVYLEELTLQGISVPLVPRGTNHKRTVLTTKTVTGGANSADDIVSESATTGTDWDFSFGGTGYITKAVLASATNAITPRSTLFLYSFPPTCTLNDNAPSNGPVAADIPYLVGYIDFPAMTDSGTGHSYSIATPGTTGDLPLMFDSPTLYGVLVSKDAATWGNVLVSISLGADMED